MTVKPSVDQWTLVLQMKDIENKEFEIEEWSDYARYILNTFFKKSKLLELFGNDNLAVKNKGRIKSYTEGYTFNLPYYIHFAFHPDQPRMGVLIDVSAQFWKAYQQKYGEKFDENLQLYHLIQMIEAEVYTARFSRIDMVVDFIDEGIDVGKIYRSLESGRSEFRHVAKE